MCVWGGGVCSLLLGNPNFEDPYLLVQVVYKVARVGRPATDYKIIL